MAACRVVYNSVDIPASSKISNKIFKLLFQLFIS